MMLNIAELVKGHEEKLKKIKAVALDVDGILTDGHVQWQGSEVGFNRSFHVRDGYVLKLLMEKGYKVAIISGGNSKGLLERIFQLGIEDYYLGDEDKRNAYQDFRRKHNLKDEEILYMADELFDIPILKKAGFAATVPEASIEVRDVCDYISKTPAGKGCAREVIDMLRYVQKIQPDLIDF